MKEAFSRSLKYRLTFYAGGILFAIVSYISGLWAFGAESTMVGKTDVFTEITRNLESSISYHILSLSIWMAVCTAIALTIGYIFDREVHYRQKAELKASIDGLTGLYNHRYFQDRLQMELERAERYNRKLSVIMFDLDNFKQFNDTWGHQEGDKLLHWFSDICLKAIRNVDLVARYGGEEFVLVLPETDTADAVLVAERIKAMTSSQSVAALGKNKRATVSGGVSTFPVHGASRHVLILNADAALYHAKQKGKNKICTYSGSCNGGRLVSHDHIAPENVTENDVEVIQALGAAVDSRDAYAKGHSGSVMQMAVALGRQLGMNAEEVENLRVASLLHDIGKVVIPEQTLEKNTPLAAKEWALIKNHTRMGSALLRRVQQMPSIIPGVKHHHERFDGTGYPSRLAGHNIPLLARIISIADAYEAMTNARSYHKAISKAEALKQLRQCAGTQFDPDLVEIFIRNMSASSDKEEAA